jgi:hypothetical protein
MVLIDISRRRDSSVDVRATVWAAEVSFPGGKIDFSLLQIGTLVPPTPCLMVIGSSFAVGKAAGT